MDGKGRKSIFLATIPALQYIEVMIKRRTFLAGASVILFAGKIDARGTEMFGLIGKMTAKPGQRDALMALITQGADAMPGCISYIVAKAADQQNDIWITEVWDSEASHAASLKLPSVAAAIGKAIPLIDMTAEGFQQKTVPVGGKGLSSAV